jgi:hypothetical protein
MLSIISLYNKINLNLMDLLKLEQGIGQTLVYIILFLFIILIPLLDIIRGTNVSKELNMNMLIDTEREHKKKANKLFLLILLIIFLFTIIWNYPIIFPILTFISLGIVLFEYFRKS